MLANQIAAPNSPQWFNTGLHWAYGIDGPAQGHYYVDPFKKVLVKAESAYEHPQTSACFIQSVKDDLVNADGIMDLWVKEARIFKYGSGSGTNVSDIRGEGEQLSGGGQSSGLMSFLKIGDRATGAIKSGGTTRRAAKMVIVDDDHPDLMSFINWKVREEYKVAALVAGSKTVAKHLKLIINATCCLEGLGALSERNDPKKNKKLASAIREAQKAFVPEPYIARVLEQSRQGVIMREDDAPIFDLDWQSEAYETVSGQNSNN